MTRQHVLRRLALAVPLLATLAACSLPKSPLNPPLNTVMFKPDGNGPFPAVVVLSSCAGVGTNDYDWAKRLKSEGYTALIVNSLAPRHVSMNCNVWAVSVEDVVSDAFAAQAYLRTLPFIDSKHIGAIGFSFGAMAGLRLASTSYIKRAGRPDAAFQAIVALYPFCQPVTTVMPYAELQNNLREDVATPLLMLIGGADNETDPRQCVSGAKSLESDGKPVSHKFYPEATHEFDNTSFRFGFRRGPYFYKYNEAATRDAAERVHDFFAKYLKQPGR